MIQTAKRLEQLGEYVHARLAKELQKVEKETGRKVLNFGPGTPDIPPSQEYLEKFGEFITEKTAHLYPGYTAIPEFADAISSWERQRFGVELQKDEILPLLGAKDGVTHLPLAILDPGDEILIPDPGYPAYIEPALMIGAKPIPYSLLEENDYLPDIQQLEGKVTLQTKAIWLNYPANPLGQVAMEQDLLPIVEFAKKHNLIILYDNAYSEITFDGKIAPSILQISGAKDITVELFSFSKTYSFAGFRMGWVSGNKPVVETLAKVKSQIDSGMSLPLQKLGAYVLTHEDRTWHDYMIETYQHRRDIIAEKIKTLGLQFQLPSGSLYIWAKIPDNEKNAEEYCLRLLREKQILFTPGSAFGKNGDRYVRVSFCVNIEKIENYF